MTIIDARKLDALNEVVDLEITLCRAVLAWAKAAEKASGDIDEYKRAEQGVQAADQAWRQALGSICSRDVKLSEDIFRVGPLHLTADMIQGDSGPVRDIVRAAEAVRNAREAHEKANAGMQKPVAARNKAWGDVLRAQSAVDARADEAVRAMYIRLLSGATQNGGLNNPDFRWAREQFEERLRALGK